jgi:dienelactone hydrolase
MSTGLLGTLAFAQDLPPSGPFGAVMEHDPAHAPAITVYRPRDLTASSNLPIVAWGNGGCRALGGARARRFLLELASHGYLIVSPGRPGPDAELMPTSNRDPSPRLEPVPPGNDETQSAELTGAIDWAVGENTRPGSIYRNRVDVRRVGVMGHSCGGLQALAVQDDPRIAASMIWNSGIYERPAGRVGVRLTRDHLVRVHAPILYAQGGPTDIAFDAANSDFALLPAGIPAVKLEANVGHSGTFAQARGGSYAVIAKAWLDWHIKGERSASRMFIGADCTLCRDADWKISRRSLD